MCEIVTVGDSMNREVTVCVRQAVTVGDIYRGLEREEGVRDKQSLWEIKTGTGVTVCVRQAVTVGDIYRGLGREEGV